MVTHPPNELPADRPSTIDFASFRLDLQGGRLLRGDQTIALRPKTWAVLLHLAQRPGVLVSTDGLLDAVWPDIAVTPGVVSKSIGELRVALGDERKTPQFIETVPRRGFRFIATMRNAADETPRLGRAFVGREEELQHLAQRFARAQAGERQVVFITGPAGIGKTALLDAFLDSAAVRQGGAPVWIGRADCIELHGLREPYMPVLKALERLGRRSDGGRLLQLLRRNAPTWLAQMPWLLDEAELPALRESLQIVRPPRMLRELAVLLEALTRDITLVLALEDLHWSDPSTVDLLSLLAQRRDPARLLLIGTYRPAEVAVSEHPLASVVRTLQAHRQCLQLPLLDLTEEAVRRYLDVRFPGSDFAPSLARRIHAHTDGDPLFMVAIVDHLLARGQILDTAPGWALAAPLESMDLGVPEDVRLMIESQLEHLSPAERSVLEAASVAGVDALAPVIAAALGGDVDEVERRCETLARTQRFLRVAASVDGPDGGAARRYAFAHELHRQIVYERMPDGQCARLHQSVGEALDAAYGARAPEIAARLAAHFELSRDRTRALYYLAAAGTQARARYANREAISYFESALAVVALLPDANEQRRQELDVRMALGPALGDLHGFTAEQVRENYERAAELGATSGTEAQRFEVLYALWYLHAMRGEGRATTAIVAQLDDLARRSGTPEQGILADSVLARTALYEGRFTDVRAYFESLCAREEQRSDRHVLVDYGMDPVLATTLHYAMALWFLGDPEKARAMAAGALARAREASNPFFLCAAQVQAALIELLCREPARGGDLAKQAASLSAAQGFTYWNRLAVALRGWARVQQGRAAHGSGEIERVLGAMRADRAQFFSAFLCAFLAEGRWRAGNPAAGLAAVKEGLRLTEVTLDRAYACELWRLKGELLLATSEKGRRRGKHEGNAPVAGSQWPEAERCLLRALERSRAAQARSLELRAATSLARAWRAHGRAADAWKLLAPVCDWFGAAAGGADLVEGRALLRELARAR